MRLALGAGVVSLRLLGQRLEMELGLGYSQSWGERSQPPWERSAGSSRGLCCVRSVDGGGEVKPTLGAAGSVRLSSTRHVDCSLVGWFD